jgi:hypothetical protein
MGNIFTKKIYADCGLNMGIWTLSFYSNLLLTNRSMMLVFPELLSPSSMTLKVLFPIVEDVIDMIFQI